MSAATPMGGGGRRGGGGGGGRGGMGGGGMGGGRGAPLTGAAAAIHASEKEYKWRDFVDFMGPILWKGSCAIKLASISLLLMLISSVLFSTYFPIIFKTILDNIVCDRSKADNKCISEKDGYLYIFFYVLVRFLGEVLQNVK